jgi:prepilin-type N-terminal cleavage/methylation domain-containing protein
MNMKKLGFTLLELMVVIAIIGILAAVVTANLSDSKRLARDKEKIATLSQIVLSLGIYKDKNNQYPNATASNLVSGLTVLVTGNFINALPTSNIYKYYPVPAGTPKTHAFVSAPLEYDYAWCNRANGTCGCYLQTTGSSNILAAALDHNGAPGSIAGNNIPWFIETQYLGGFLSCNNI